MIDVQCPACGKAYRVGEDKAGKKFRCKGCEKIVSIPSASLIEEFDDYGAGVDDYGAPADDRDDFSDAYSPRPSRGAGRPQTRRRKAMKKKKSSGGKVGIIIGSVIGGVVVAGLLVVGIVFAVRNSTGSAYARHEKVAEELTDQTEELASAMESVRDQESARAAAIRINAICDKLDALATRAKELPKITKREDEKLREKYFPRLEAASARVKMVALNARQIGARNPSFVAALKRLEQTGRRLQQSGRGF
jgi:hypothetical protein